MCYMPGMVARKCRYTKPLPTAETFITEYHKGRWVGVSNVCIVRVCANILHDLRQHKIEKPETCQHCDRAIKDVTKILHACV